MQLRDIIRIVSMLKGSYTSAPKTAFRVILTEKTVREISINAVDADTARTIAEGLYRIDKKIFERLSKEKRQTVTSSTMSQGYTGNDYSRGIWFEG